MYLDRGRLLGPSAWVIQATHMSFSNSIMGTRLKRDKSRLNKYAVRYGLTATHSDWGSIISQHERFLFPENIQCDCTFASDRNNVYYHSTMEEFIKQIQIGEEFQLCDIPLL